MRNLPIPAKWNEKTISAFVTQYEQYPSALNNELQSWLQAPNEHLATSIEKHLGKESRFRAQKEEITAWLNEFKEPVLESLRELPVIFKDLLLFLISPKTPIIYKIPIMLVVVYVVSPIDIIPDAIPVAGFMDDLAIVVSSVKGYLMKGIVMHTVSTSRKNPQYYDNIERNIAKLLESSPFSVFLKEIQRYIQVIDKKTKFYLKTAHK